MTFKFKLLRSNSTLPGQTLIALMWLLSLPQLAHAYSPQSPGRDLVVTVGKSVLVNSPVNIQRVAVGFGDIAEARVIDPKEVLVDGKAAGETSLIIWQEGGNKLFFDVTVRPSTTAVRARFENLTRELQQNLPGQDVHASFENDTIFLTGTAKDLTSAERAVAIASASGKTVNLLYVSIPDSEAQILLKVRFATVNRSASQDLGINLVSTGAGNTIGSVSTGQYAAPSVGTAAGSSSLTLGDALNIFLFRPQLNLAATIRALETKGMLETLSEPNVLAVNGKQASFLAGGEFPYPILQGGGLGLGTVTIAFREFGVRLNFLPLITPRGTIRLAVAPEVSALDYTSGLSISGFTVPGLASRRVQTEIELESGQSFAIAGLLDRQLTETIERIPLLASIPLLGKLFQSRAKSNQNTELLVIVTPELVRPIPAGAALPKLDMPYPLPNPSDLPRTPGLGTTGPVPVHPPTASVPMEKLMQSIQEENKLKLVGKDISVQSQTSPEAPLAFPGTVPPATPTTPPTGPIKQQ